MSDFLRRLDWPQAALVLGLATLATLLVLYGPDEVRVPASGILVTLAGVMRGVLRPPDAPPPSSGSGGLAGAVLALVVSSQLLTSGCGASALRTQATAALVAGPILDDACRAVRTQRAREQTAAVDAASYSEDARLAVDGVRLRWEPAVDACELVADAHGAWVDALALASAGAQLDLSAGLGLAGRLVVAWSDLARILAAYDIPLPEPPAQLVVLVPAGDR